MAKLVSKTYGEALFELAMEAGPVKADEMLSQVQQIRKILKDNPEFDKLMMHPGIPKQEKMQVMENVWKGKVSDELAGFLQIVITKER